MSVPIFDATLLGQELIRRGVCGRDRVRVIWWWGHSKPGETMLLVGAFRPYLRIDHDGNVTEEDPVHSGWTTSPPEVPDYDTKDLT